MTTRRACFRRSTRSALVVFAAWASLWSGFRAEVKAYQEDGWYTPQQEDFRPAYERDKVNQRVQTWNQYWGWIESFYGGNGFSVGWTRQARATIAVVKSEDKQRELMALLNDLGKRISMEWAKDNGVRKISTADLNRWNALIVRAQRAERGSGERLKSVLQTIRAEVRKKMGR